MNEDQAVPAPSLDTKTKTMKDMILFKAASAKLNKEDLAARAQDIVTWVERGDITALGASTWMAGVIAVFEAAKKAISSYAVSEATQWDKKEACVVNGAKITVVSGGKYDYAACNDEEYNALVMRKEALDAQIKARQEFLKAMTKPEQITDEDSGEIRKILPAKKIDENTIKIEFPKGA